MGAGVRPVGGRGCSDKDDVSLEGCGCVTYV